MKSTSRKKTAKNTGGQLFEFPSFANDAAANASVASGVAKAGSMYYNTVSNKLKVKENGTWKTVTTS